MSKKTNSFAYLDSDSDSVSDIDSHVSNAESKPHIGQMSNTSDKRIDDTPVECLTVDGEHKLNSSWVMWEHGVKDPDYSMKAYTKIYQADTLEDFLSYQRRMPGMNTSMYFLMRAGFRPRWDDPENINGGAYKFKIDNNHTNVTWLELAVRLIGETICDEANKVVGMSISPRKSFSTIRVWLHDKTFRDISKFTAVVPYMNFKHAIYEEHKVEQSVKPRAQYQRNSYGKSSRWSNRRR